jgi:cyclic pyranopterin phosphate synthase
MDKELSIKIYTDGACSGNPGRGGWAAVVVDGDKRVIHGVEDNTTNNRMEILAAIKGLEITEEGSVVTVYSDSQYVVNTMVKGWKRKANLDLWARLDKISESRNVSWEWVKGHSGDPLNEEADHWAAWSAGTGDSVDTDKILPAKRFSHTDAQGKVKMVDVSDKDETYRKAVAEGVICMKPETLQLIMEGNFDKGDVIATARIAGIMGAKKTSEIIPLCHPISLTNIEVLLEPDVVGHALKITATAEAKSKTGVEMEALTAVVCTGITIYDMCKAVDRGMSLDSVKLISKTGGKSGDIRLT